MFRIYVIFVLFASYSMVEANRPQKAVKGELETVINDVTKDFESKDEPSTLRDDEEHAHADVALSTAGEEQDNGSDLDFSNLDIRQEDADGMVDSSYLEQVEGKLQDCQNFSLPVMPALQGCNYAQSSVVNAVPEPNLLRSAGRAIGANGTLPSDSGTRVWADRDLYKGYSCSDLFSKNWRGALVKCKDSDKEGEKGVCVKGDDIPGECRKGVMDGAWNKMTKANSATFLHMMQGLMDYANMKAVEIEKGSNRLDRKPRDKLVDVVWTNAFMGAEKSDKITETKWINLMGDLMRHDKSVTTVIDFYDVARYLFASEGYSISNLGKYGTKAGYNYYITKDLFQHWWEKVINLVNH